MRQAGQSLLEATFGLVIIVAVVIALLDLAIVVFGASLNDSACRNAARAAASGEPGEAEYRARAAIEQSSGSEFVGVISCPKLVLPVAVKVTSRPLSRKDPETYRVFNPGGLVIGTVTVVTEVEIKPFGTEFIFWRREPFVFKTSQSFPIHYVVPAG